MLADEILDHLARLDMDAETARRELARQYKRVKTGAWDPGSTLGLVISDAEEAQTTAVNERDAFVAAVRHHRLEQAHNSETCPLCEPAWKPAPVDRRCPACNAAPGKPCTAPTDTSRRPVGWHHLSREAD